MLNRRSFLKTAAVAMPVARAAEGDSLRARAAARGLLYGAAAAFGPVERDEDYARHFAEECGILVPENALKFGPVHPEPERFNFTQADALADFAAKNRMKMRGHNLVWHQQLGPWFRGTVTAENARRYLEAHIRTVMGHYKGRMHSWDVVNEAVHPPDGRDDGLRKSPWLEVLGPDYVHLAFTLAAEADPDTMLVYNDYGLDYDTPGDSAKRAAVLKLLRGMVKRKIPVRGFGMQAHLAARHQQNFKGEVLRRFFGEIAALGLKILITELDVADQSLPADVAERDRAVAAVYESYLTAALAEPAVIAVLTWGLTDKYTWLANQNRRDDGAPVRVLPLDQEYRRKPAWNAIAKAFDGAGKRA
jgi:endo-1,4-beta-xylanase